MACLGNPVGLERGARYWLMHTTTRGFRSMFHMSKAEFRTYATLLTPSIVVPGLGVKYLAWDAIAIILCLIAINATASELADLFATTVSSVIRIIDAHLAPMARLADELWGLKGPWSEVDRARFAFFPDAVAAVDSTPIRVHDSPGCRYLRKALCSAKHSIPAWKLTVAVAPNGICIWRCLLDPGRRNDKRAFDQSDAAEAFLFILEETAGIYRQERLALIMDRGYVGVPKYWPSVIIRRDGPHAEVFEYNLCVDSDRSIVECFFGVLKRTFRILGDEGCRLAFEHIEDVHTLCIALANANRRGRGYARTPPPPGFFRTVPVPVS